MIMIRHKRIRKNIDKCLSRPRPFCTNSNYGGRTPIVTVCVILYITYNLDVIKLKKIVNETEAVFLIHKNSPPFDAAVEYMVKFAIGKNYALAHTHHIMGVGPQ